MPPPPNIMCLPELVEGSRVALWRWFVRQAHPAELCGVGAVAAQLRVHACYSREGGCLLSIQLSGERLS